MSTQSQPEIPSSEEHTEELNNEQSTQQTNQPTSPPTDPRVTPAFVELLQGTLSEKNRQIDELNARLNAQTSSSTPQLSDEEARTKFFENPFDATQNIVRKEIQDSTRELREFVSEIRGQTIVDQLVNKFKNDPRFVNIWDSAIETLVRQEASRLPPAGLNDNSFYFIVLSAVGLKATNQLGAPIPEPAQTQQTQTREERTVPPHIRSSAPQAPRAVPQNNEVVLNEHENRLLREYNAKVPADKRLTPKQWKDLQNMPSNEVITSNIRG